MSGRCGVFLIGGFRVDVDGQPVGADGWRHRRGADVVKLLAITPSHRLHREQVIETLWPDLGPDAGAANLRKALHYARRALGAEDALTVEGGMVRLWPHGELRVDADDFEVGAARALERNDAGVAAELAARYSGDLLPEDRFVEWTQASRERLRRLHLQVLKLAGRWERLVELDPLDEEAHRALMRAHLDAGSRQAAMRQFEALREILHEELGVGPDPATVALYEEVLALEGTEPSTPAERAAAHLAAGLVALNRMDLEEAEREARVARELAIHAGLGRELGEASGLLGMVGHSRGAWPDLFREEFLDVVREAPDLAEFVFDAHLCLAEFSLHGGEGPDQVAAYARDLLEVADRFGSVHGQALATLILGEARLLLGDVEGAEADLSKAAELHGRAGASSGRAMALERLAQAAVARGRRARARRLLADAHGLALDASLVSHLLVRVYGTKVLAARDERAAADVARAAREDLAGREVCEPCSIGYLLASATAFARIGDLPEASQSLEHAERVSRMWHAGPWPAAVWEARAEVRVAEGEWRQGAAFFREAAELFARAGHRLAEARCRAAADAAVATETTATPG